MVEQLASFLDHRGLMPHGHCFTWRAQLLWPMVAADLAIALAYFSIPLALMTLVRQRGDAVLRAPAWLFSAFIFCCGISHLMDAWVIWVPDYGMQVVWKIITAVVSVATAGMLWTLLPKARQIPTQAQFEAMIHALETEVSQRKSAEESLLDTQEALVLALASIGAGFIATNQAGQVTRMNAVAEKVTGWTQTQAKGQSLWEVFAREDRPADYPARNPIDVLLELGITFDQVHRMVAVSRTNERTIVDAQAALTHAADGSVRGIAIVFKDMTRLNQAETERHLLAAIVESSQDAIIGKRLDGTITSWNQAACHIFGHTAEEAIGQSVQMLIPADRKDEETRIVAELVAGVRVPPFETRRTRKDGTLIDVSITISPIEDAQGKIIGASKIARDISQQKQADMLRAVGQRLEAENRQILEASRLKSEFLANMSHELRTPLNAIIGFADLLRSGAVPLESPKHPQFLQHIGTSGRHLLQLINDVLDLSKVEAGKLEFTPELVDLTQLVGEVSDVLQSVILKQGVRIDAHIDPSVTRLQIDPARLKQVLYNYLSNAIKFTPAGGRIALRALPEGPDHVRIEVEDTGIGIAPQDLSRLFQEFQQLDSSANKRHAGTGLGLSLTRRLVQAQGGSVGVRSTLGVGSVFHVILKRDNSPNASGLHHFLLIHGSQQASELDTLTQTLSAIGYVVDTAADGAQALHKIQEQHYAAISLDLLLPDRPGLEVLSRIRDHETPARAPSVVSVNMTAGQDVRASFPVADVIAKPIQDSELATVLARAGMLNKAGGADVMVIDDDPMARTLMAETLQAMGLRSIPMSSGLQALQALEQWRPDCIMLDLMMPGCDGFEVLAMLRQRPQWCEIPVFVWTSMLLTDEEYATLARSAQAIVAKGGGGLQTLLQDIQRRGTASLSATMGGQA